MKVSVIIPCRNEKNHIVNCIESIYSNSISVIKEIEVIVVDGKSDDGTWEILEELKKTYPKLILITNEKRVTPVAFNLGIKASTGDFIQIIGARQIIDKFYLEQGVQTIQNDPRIWCVGGQVENIHENSTSETIALAMDTPFGVGLGNFRVLKKSAFTDTVGTPMYPKKIFETIGLFDENLVRNQDDEFNFRVSQAGGLIYLNSEMHIRYFVRAAFKNLFRQYFQYGYWKVYVNKKHRSLTTWRQLVPPFWILFLFVGIPFCFLSKYFLFFYLGILLMYTFLGLFYALTKAKFRFRFISIFYTFFLLHFGYGMGYLKGIFHFYILKRKPNHQSQLLTR